MSTETQTKIDQIVDRLEDAANAGESISLSADEVALLVSAMK
jgi:hypothetical protein